MNVRNVLVTALVLLNLAACTWVDLTAEGEQVRVLKSAAVTHCKHLGKTTVKTAAKAVGLERHDYKVLSELETLARNSAVEMGGDTVVASGTPVDGRQQYEIYRCLTE